MRHVGLALLLLERADEGGQWMQRAVRAQVATAGERDPWTALMRAQLARFSMSEGRHAEAVAILKAAVEQLEAVDGHGGLLFANVRLWLGRALVETGRAEQALPYVTAAVQYLRRTRVEGHPMRAEADCELAVVQAARGRLDEAFTLAKSCVPRIATYRPGGAVARGKRAAAADATYRRPLSQQLTLVAPPRKRASFPLTLTLSPHAGRGDLIRGEGRALSAVFLSDTEGAAFSRAGRTRSSSPLSARGERGSDSWRGPSAERRLSLRYGGRGLQPRQASTVLVALRTRDSFSPHPYPLPARGERGSDSWRGPSAERRLSLL